MIVNGEGIKKWENRRDFNFSYLHLVGSGKVERLKKMNLYKFAHMSLLKNNVQLKQNSDKQPKKIVTNNQKKKQSPKFIKKEKSYKKSKK